MEAKIGNTINLLLNVVMGVVLGITGQTLMGQYSLIGFLQTFCMTMGVGYLLGSFVPVMKIGSAFADLCHAQRGLPRYLLSTLAISVVMVHLVTAFSVFIQAGTAAPAVFVQMILPFLLVGILAIEATLWMIQRIVVNFMTH